MTNYKPKILAMYLPQFHETPENNQFWGEGFTDWVSVKNAEKAFEAHEQPKVPLNKNYYDLTNCNTLKWQASLARKYNLDGFCIYHYWFKNNKKVLYKPAEILLSNKDIDINFCFSWDNTSWIRTWSKLEGNAWAPLYEVDKFNKNKYLLELDYGDIPEWQKHFEYLLPFFKDKRYVKIDGKPVFSFFSTNNKTILTKMGEYWDKLAINNGFPGLFLISRCDPIIRKKLFDSEFIYQPITTGWQRKTVIQKKINNLFKTKTKCKGPILYNYDKIWKKILLESKLRAKHKIILGGFVNYDDTPRRGNNGCLILDGTPEKFKTYFNELYKICLNYNKEIVFLTAWNEWGEGAYLEPDEKNGYKYLQAVKAVVERYR